MPFTNGIYSDSVPIQLNHGGSEISPSRIVMHYTVTDTLSAARSALNSRNLSYTFLVDRDGAIHQSRPVTRSSAHAGRSNWKSGGGVGTGSSVNLNSVSISFINRGFFARRNGNVFFDLDAHNNMIGRSYPQTEVEAAVSIYDPGSRRHWHKFTDAQLRSARKLIEDLKQAFQISELVGHDDVAIDGKSDTGPLFPMEEWRRELGLEGGLGLESRVNTPGDHLVLRRRPSSTAAEVTRLAHNSRLHVRSVVYTFRQSQALEFDGEGKRYLTRWASVDIDGSNRHSGFVHMRHLTKTPLAANLAARL